MNPQYKKGILELVILSLLYQENLYGFALISKVPVDIGISEGTIYPLLKRLKEEKIIDSYMQETSDGPPRKYYFITATGKKYYLQMRKNFIVFDNAVNAIIRREHDE